MGEAAMHSSLRGLTIGDAFGFKLGIRPAMQATRSLPDSPWRWSDDALMASSVVHVLTTHGHVDQDALFADFVRRFHEQPQRGYGGGMKKLLGRSDGTDWREASGKLFGGSGSFGNGAAMRVAPLGAYFAEHPQRVAEQARLSAAITHTHPEGISGAIAIAQAAAALTRDPNTPPVDLIAAALEDLPAGEVRSGLEHALTLDPADPEAAAAALGNGALITAQDTVPLCVWWAAHYRADPEDALWRLVALKGDEDTNCAIVAGLWGAAGVTLPVEWDAAVEGAPEFVARGC